LTPAQLALVWARQREYMGAVIIGATTLAQLKENIEAFDLPDLSPAVLRRIDAVDERLAAAYYRGVQPGAVRGEDTGSVEMEVEVEVEAQGGEPEKEPRMVER
jgi:diketogulonate reductase-like aldo/keto reductase